VNENLSVPNSEKTVWTTFVWPKIAKVPLGCRSIAVQFDHSGALSAKQCEQFQTFQTVSVSPNRSWFSLPGSVSFAVGSRLRVRSGMLWEERSRGNSATAAAFSKTFGSDLRFHSATFSAESSIAPDGTAGLDGSAKTAEGSALKSEPGNERKTSVRFDLEVGVESGVEREVISKGCLLEEPVLMEDTDATRGPRTACLTEPSKTLLVRNFAEGRVCRVELPAIFGKV
jgi:hypothetical protein